MRRTLAKARIADKSAGFTVPELISVMAVTLIFSGLIVFFTFEYWRATATLSNDLQTYTSRLTAGDRLRDAINASSGLIVQNGIADDNVGAPDPDAGSDYWRPLHAVPGRIATGGTGTTTPVLYFKAPSINTSKQIILNGSQPFEDEFVLYLDGTTKQLRMRTLANVSAPDNRALTTCPEGSTDEDCPVDRLIAEDISGVSLRYFSRSGNLMDYTSITDPDSGEYIGPDMPAVEVVEFVLDIFRRSTLKGGADTTNQTIIRIALRNS